MTEPTSRVSQAARLLDCHARFSFVDFKLHLSIYTRDVTGMDAFIRLCARGYKATIRASGQGRLLRVSNEEVLRRVLADCLPHMRERGALVAAALEFLNATTPDEMMRGIRKTSLEMLKWPTRF